MAKQTLTVDIYVKELTYDIQNKTYLTGRSRYDGKNDEEAANMKANEDEENMNQILRSIGNALGNIKTELSEYMSDTALTANNIQLTTPATDNEKKTITLTMPSNYNAATRDSIANGIHQYIVNSSIAEWFTITNKADAADYANLSVANLDTIRTAINKRVAPTRPTVVATP